MNVPDGEEVEFPDVSRSCEHATCVSCVLGAVRGAVDDDLTISKTTSTNISTTCRLYPTTIPYRDAERWPRDQMTRYIKKHSAVAAHA